jgi:REP element-mobilizing transposase RayT
MGHGRPPRLPGHDYRLPGAYFITIVTYGRRPILADWCGEDVIPTTAGRVVYEEWSRSAELRAEITLDAFVVMPDHVHGIVWLSAQPELGSIARSQQPATRPSRPPRSLSTFVGGFKAAAARGINLERGTPGRPVWQSNYYEHVVRGVANLERIRWYVRTNPDRHARIRARAGWPALPCGPTAGSDRVRPS